MKKLICVLLVFGLVLPLSAQEATTNWSLGVAGNYTAFGDGYIPKVAEYKYYKDGFFPEMKFNWNRYNGMNKIQLNGAYYNPKEMLFGGDFRLGKSVLADVSYKSFYRNTQLDLLENISARESLNREGTAPGGKILSHEIQNPNEQLGYQRQEIEANLKFLLPGDKITLRASHRTIMEDGKMQHVQNMHCASCHLVSRPLDVKNKTQSLTAGLDAALGVADLSYEVNVRKFISDAGPYSAYYDSAGHPGRGYIWTDPNTGATSNYYVEFGSRLVYHGEDVAIAAYPETNKLSHKITAKSNIGKGRLLLQYQNTTLTNDAQLADPNVTITGDLKVTANNLNGNYSTPLMENTKLILAGKYRRLENEDLSIDNPDWRDNRPGGDIDLDYIRYSSLTRTDLEGSAKVIYQPKRSYRLTALLGFNSVERDNFPIEGANFKTDKTMFELGVRYRPTGKFTGDLKYGLENIDNPFSPVDQMFEMYGRGTLMPTTGAPNVYYWQRDDLRYGNISNMPAMVHNIKATVKVQPNKKVKLDVGLNLKKGSNDTQKELDFQQTTMAPNLGLTLIPNDKVNFFANYTYVKQTQNGLAAVALMDG
ncbi:MAG: hypothetical protein H6696_17010 [Deferribacteres bacterium]|nr:hypothetical protein [candidate division KSB1 bacterium]MCB9503635.1 hypothetical protein [Deferribacteres bacterium]